MTQHGIRIDMLTGAFRIALFWPGRDHAFILRIGRPRYRLSTERYQGMPGIPIRWHYALSGRIALRIPTKGHR